MQHEVLAILAEAHDYHSYLQKLEIARAVFANYEDRLANGEVDIKELVVSKTHHARTTRLPESRSHGYCGAPTLWKRRA